MIPKRPRRRLRRGHAALRQWRARALSGSPKPRPAWRTASRIRVSGTKGSLEWQQERPTRLTFKPLDGPVRVYTPNGPGSLPASARACRIVAGHPEGFHEAFANIYSDAAEAIAARRSGRRPDPLALRVPERTRRRHRREVRRGRGRVEPGQRRLDGRQARPSGEVVMPERREIGSLRGSCPRSRGLRTGSTRTDRAPRWPSSIRTASSSRSCGPTAAAWPRSTSPSTRRSRRLASASNPAPLASASRTEGFPLTNFGDPRYTGWGGGVPIIVGGEVIGAIGVSGLPEASRRRAGPLGGREPGDRFALIPSPWPLTVGPDRRIVAVMRRAFGVGLRLTIVGVGAIAVGIVVLFGYALSEVIANPGISLVDGYWTGRLPWTAIGVDLVVIGSTVAVLFGTASSWLAGDAARRLVSLAPVVVAAAWWLYASIQSSIEGAPCMIEPAGRRTLVAPSRAARPHSIPSRLPTRFRPKPSCCSYCLRGSAP